MSKGVLLNSKDVPILRKMVQDHKRKKRGTPQTLRKRWPVAAGGGGKVARTTGEHCQGDTQTVEIMTGAKGSETGSGVFVDAYNRFMSLSSNAIVIILDVGNGYDIIAANCNDAANASSCSSGV